MANQTVLGLRPLLVACSSIFMSGRMEAGDHGAARLGTALTPREFISFRFVTICAVFKPTSPDLDTMTRDVGLYQRAIGDFGFSAPHISFAALITAASWSALRHRLSRPYPCAPHERRNDVEKYRCRAWWRSLGHPLPRRQTGGLRAERRFPRWSFRSTRLESRRCRT